MGGREKGAGRERGRGVNVRIVNLELSKTVKVTGIKCCSTLTHYSIKVTYVILLYFRPHGLKVYKFVGDRTGVLHVGPNQVLAGQFADHEKFEVNVYVHKTGHLHLPPSFTCFGIQITNRLVLIS